MRRETLKSILIGVAVGAVVIAAILLASRLEKLWGGRVAVPSEAFTAETAAAPQPTPEPETAETPMPADVIYYKGEPYVPKENLRAMLIMGVDDEEVTETGSYRNNGQADFLLVAVFDDENKTCELLQINRDTMSDVPVLGALGDYIGVTNEQIALAHTYGSGLEDSCENTVDAVSRLLYDTDIDNYMSLTMGGIAVLNDLVGGVTVTVEDDFTGVDDTLIQGETVTLMGEHAENFVRARMSMTDDSSNLARMRRQRTYMTALTERLKAAVSADASFVLTAYAALADYMLTDCDIYEMSDYAEQLTSYTLSDIVTPEGEAKKGEEFMEFYVDEDALQELVIDTFYLPWEEDGNVLS